MRPSCIQNRCKIKVEFHLKSKAICFEYEKSYGPGLFSCSFLHSLMTRPFRFGHFPTAAQPMTLEDAGTKDLRRLK